MGLCRGTQDRLALVTPLLGLYAEALVDTHNPTSKAVLADINRDKLRVFPKTIELKDEKAVRTHELFGDAVEKLEYKLDTDPRLREFLQNNVGFKSTAVGGPLSLSRAGTSYALTNTQRRTSKKRSPHMPTQLMSADHGDASSLTA
jgi:hypothetical protein